MWRKLLLTTEDRQGKIATKYNSNRHATLWHDCYLFQGIATAVTPSHLCFIFINLFFTASCRLTTSWHGFPFLTHTLFHAPVTHQALRHYVCEYALQRSFLALVLHVRYWKKQTNIFKKTAWHTAHLLHDTPCCTPAKPSAATETGWCIHHTPWLPGLPEWYYTLVTRDGRAQVRTQDAEIRKCMKNEITLSLVRLREIFQL